MGPSGDLDPARASKPRARTAGSTADSAANAHKPAVTAFHDRYLAAYGQKPTWNAKTIAMIKRLVQIHGVDEVVRRIGILFDRPPEYVTTALDVATLVQFFDKLAIGLAPRAPMRHGKVDAFSMAMDELRRLEAVEAAAKRNGAP